MFGFNYSVNNNNKNSLFDYWYPKKKKTIVEDFMNDVSTELLDLTKDCLPLIQNEVKKKLNEVKEELSNNINETNIKEIVNMSSSILANNLKNIIEKNKELENPVNETIKKNQSKLNIMMSNFNSFDSKLKMADEYCSLISEKKKVIKILAVGDTQQGKTSTVKYLFQIPDSELCIKNNLESDTKEIKEYEIKKGNVTLKYVDCPGFNDSRGENQKIQNKKEITKYFQRNNDIDLIFWVSKLDRILDSNHKQLINELTNFSNNIWERSIIILTCANSSSIPDCYFPINQNDTDNTEEEIMLNAWTKYTNDKITLWKDYFSGRIKNIPVCLVENSKRYTKLIEGVRVLKDGSPFWELLMFEVFNTVQKDKSPLSFIAMVNKNDIEHSKALINASDRVLSSITQKYTNIHTISSESENLIDPNNSKDSNETPENINYSPKNKNIVNPFYYIYNGCIIL